MGKMSKSFIGCAVVLSLAVFSFVYASKVTVDADGGADYTSLDAVLALINASSIDPDTIEMTGSDQDTYNWTTGMSVTTVGTLVIRSAQTDPDVFPILIRDANSNWNFMQTTNLYFENIIFSNCQSSGGANYAWTNATSLTTLSWKNCVIRDQSADFFISIDGEYDNTVNFENCLFEGNAKIIEFDLYGTGQPYITITNCTFDGNTALFTFTGDGIPDSPTHMSVKNCIFSNNTQTFPSGDGVTFKGLTTYSLTSESTSGYGSGCVSDADPDYVETSRADPSDWKIVTGSPAEDIGTSSGAPSTDIAGTSRTNPDAGCWEIEATTIPKVMINAKRLIILMEISAANAFSLKYVL